MSSSSLCFLLCLTAGCIGAVRAGGFKILGGYVQEYSESSSDYYGKAYKWGQSEVDENSKEIGIENMYCWSINNKKDGYCYHYLVVSTIDDPNQEHYQIIGSYQKIYKNDAILETAYVNGITEERPPYEKMHVANGDTWCQATTNVRTGDLFFFVNKTTQPSITDDISYIVMNSKNNDEHLEEQFLDYHESTSVRVQYNGMVGYSEQWGSHTYIHGYFWRAPTTLIDMVPLEDQANFISLDYYTKKTVVLSNEGSGVTSPDLPILGTTETVTTTSQSRFMSSWDFAYSFQESISFDIFAVSSGVTMSQSFTYHTEEEMTQTNSVQTTLEITWPNECPAGFKITYSVVEISEVQQVPVELYFKRAGVVWTEIDVMDVTLRKMELTKDDCCLFDWADETCGSETLDMCDDVSS